MPWDSESAQAFGPWRLHEKAEPTQNQTLPAHDFSDQPTETNQELEESERKANSQREDKTESGLSTDSAQEPLGSSHQSANPTADAAGQDQAAGKSDSGAQSFSEQQVQIARQQGYVLGIKDGMGKALMDLESERQKERESVRSLLIELRALEQSPQRFFEPLKKLALHIAEQLVRGELSVSGQAIDRLIKSCLEDLGNHEKAVVVTVNPEDQQRLQPILQESLSQLQLEPDPKLLPGSVRVRAHDTEIQDFIEHRLDSIARKLLNEPEAWLQSAATLNKLQVEIVPESSSKRSWFSSAKDIEDAPTRALDETPSPQAVKVAPEPPEIQGPPKPTDSANPSTGTTDKSEPSGATS
jgi:flagellar biosynthesis/type III secretory pathway protein FliH